MRFLIIDGYPKPSREELEAAGMPAAWRLFDRMLKRHVPDANADVIFPADVEDLHDVAGYSGILWTGCNLCLHGASDPRVERQITLAKNAFAAGVPQFGSCWAVQIAAVAAGGRVAANPRGREVGITRKIRLTEAGRRHPMYEGKPDVFDGFISHLDEVVEIPKGGTLLAGNDFTAVQAMEVRHLEGTFWGLQYHPEYRLGEMARLILARREPLRREGFFASDEEVDTHVAALEALDREPDRKDLRWCLAIDDDVLDEDRRQVEFRNWLRVCVGLQPAALAR